MLIGPSDSSGFLEYVLFGWQVMGCIACSAFQHHHIHDGVGTCTSRVFWPRDCTTAFHQSRFLKYTFWPEKDGQGENMVLWLLCFRIESVIKLWQCWAVTLHFTQIVRIVTGEWVDSVPQVWDVQAAQGSSLQDLSTMHSQDGPSLSLVSLHTHNSVPPSDTSILLVSRVYHADVETICDTPSSWV